MNIKRIVIAGLIVTGISLLVTAIGVWLAPDLLDEPGGLIAVFAAVFVAISGLFGGKISDWANTIFGSENKEQKSTEVQQDIRDTKGGIVVGKVETINIW